MSSDPLSFMEGTSWANMVNSVVEADIEKARTRELNETIEAYEARIARLNAAVATANATIDKSNATVVRLDTRIDADAGIIALTQEEVQAAESGTLPTKRLSGDKSMIESVRKELGRLSGIDRELAMEGGRFSRDAKLHLYERLRSRIQEFVEYGVEHELSFQQAGRLKPSHVKDMWDYIEAESLRVYKGRIEGKILALQRTMNMLYIESTPRQEEFEPVNLVVAMGFSVKQLADEAGIVLPECKYTNPKSTFTADVANNQILEAARVDRAAMEREAEESIRKNCAEAEAEIALVDRRYAEDSAKRLAAKHAMANYWRLRSEMSADH